MVDRTARLEPVEGGFQTSAARWIAAVGAGVAAFVAVDAIATRAAASKQSATEARVTRAQPPGK